ncbi:AraC family transcriptional regulator [Neobacillus vireti]|uniref:AraC family transcriptional regulator n=1 Tax=Neobacillus vireti TaxID=220686 RepID=UPI002FFE0443
MKRNELKSFLLANSTSQVLDWELIKNTLSCEPIEIINGQPVYLFDKIFDVNFNQIEENIYISQLLPSKHVPMHIHQYIELIYVYQGQCTVVLQEGDIIISEGGMILIDKQTPHTVKGISSSDIIINIRLKHDYLSSGFLSRFKNKSIISQFLIESLINSRRANNSLYFPFEERSNIVEIMQNIMCEYFDKDFCSAEMIDSYLFILFTELIRYSNNSTSIQTDNMKQKDANVLDFLKYIEEHYKDCILTDMADYYKYHPNYISSVLKKETGKSFKDLLQIQRMNKAALYLLNSTLSIPDIAEEVGYSNLSFFYKKFNDVFFQTPKEYRDNKI